MISYTPIQLKTIELRYKQSLVCKALNFDTIGILKHRKRGHYLSGTRGGSKRKLSKHIN